MTFFCSTVSARSTASRLMEENMPSNDIQRGVLPIPDRKPVCLTTYDAKDPVTKFPPITPLRPPEAAPNVLLILLDDVGFGAASVFGGPCQTPNAEKLPGNSELCYGTNKE